MSKFLLLSLMGVLGFPAFALESLDDQQLARMTGQDGITISVAPAANNVQGVIGVQKIVISDKDGLAAPFNGVTYTGVGSTVFNVNTNSGVLFCTTVGTCTKTADPIVINVDAEGGGVNGPMLYVNIKTPQNANRIKIDLSGIALRADTLSAMNRVIAGPSEVEFLKFSSGIDLVLGAPIELGLALGNEGTTTSTDALINMINANFVKIDFGRIALKSTGGHTSESDLSLNVSLNSLDLSGANIDLSPAGLVLSKATVGPFDIRVDDITAGELASPPSAAFNGTSVGLLGSIGANGIRVTNLAIAVSGM